MPLGLIPSIPRKTLEGRDPGERGNTDGLAKVLATSCSLHRSPNDSGRTGAGGQSVLTKDDEQGRWWWGLEGQYDLVGRQAPSTYIGPSPRKGSVVLPAQVGPPRPASHSPETGNWVSPLLPDKPFVFFYD